MSTGESEFNGPEINGRALQLIGAGSGVMSGVAFAAIGALALENLTYGAIAGLFACVGSILFLPWMMRLSAVQNDGADDVPFREVIDRAGGDPRLGTFGMGLEAGAIVMLAVGFALAEPNPVIGLGVGIGVAALSALVAVVVFDR